MSVLPKLSLTHKIGALVTLAIFLLAGLLTALNIRIFKRPVDREFEERISSLGEQVKSVLEGHFLGMLSLPGELPPEVLQSVKNPFELLVRSKDIQYSYLLRGGEPLFQVHRLQDVQDATALKSEGLERLFAGKYPLRRSFGPNREFLEIRIPIAKSGRQFATMALGFSDEALRRATRESVYRIVAVGALGALLMSVFVVLYIKVTVSEPVVEAMVSTAEGLFHSSKQMSLSTQQSTASTRLLSSNLEAITAAVSAMARRSQQASVSSQSVSGAATKGRKALDLVLSKMGSIRVSASSAVASIGELALSSARIDDIVKLISTISGQTNLLSINATIEAARAGEAGKGFAVIAEEVRNLAGSSSASAQQISEITQSVIGKTMEASRLVTDGGKEVESGNAEIQDVVREFEAIFAGIESAAREIEQVASLAEENLSALEAASAAAKELAGTIEQIASGSGKLALTSTKLKGIADRFQVG